MALRLMDTILPSIILINFGFMLSYNCEQYLEREEKHLIHVIEHPHVDENSEIDPEPFVPFITTKPTIAQVQGSCKCGQHDYSGPMIDSLYCGDPPKTSVATLKDSILGGYVSNGTITDKSQFPWVVALVERQPNNTAVHFCGGTLISNKLVLTATHCFTARSINKTEVWLNERKGILVTQDDGATLKIKARRLIPHPQYNPIMNYNDIALIELSEPVDIEASHLRPICLPDGNSHDSSKFGFTAGWGQMEYKGPKSDVLLHVCLPVLSHNDCTTKSLSFYKKRVTEWMICAGDIKNGKRDACPGDSGGPLFVEANNRYYLIGITSWGVQCALPKRPGVYTRVSKYTPWIARQALEIENNKKCQEM